MNNEEKLNISRTTYTSGNLSLESLIFKPNGSGKFPGVVFLHGHRSSCWNSSLFGYLLTKAGFAVFIPSIVGYGLSEGEPDFSGPTTVKGVIDGIDLFLKNNFVDAKKIGAWGISRGGTVCASLAVKYPNVFKAVVLQSGAYEMKTNMETTQIQSIKDVIIAETGGSDKALKERSPIYEMEKLSCPVLILHGEKDDRVSVEQAKMLDEKLSELNKEHKTIILPELGHYITEETRDKHSIPFLKKHLIK